MFASLPVPLRHHIRKTEVLDHVCPQIWNRNALCGQKDVTKIWFDLHDIGMECKTQPQMLLTPF